ncbi:MAG: lysylphosphatidylglycerol synthase transmembrane domain-containing protein [Eubacteriales bacterium]|nr:lysylphosphatidylglycerol synthase transmembrane domain-containing protein [Eubacteriales bacterium]
MKRNRPLTRILLNAALFVGLIALTFFVLLRGQNLSELAAVLRDVKVRYLLLAAGCMCIFLLCEAINLHRCLRLFGSQCSLLHAVKYALTGFFFSSVTPSASGGQPMQLYTMHRDHVPMSHGALALLIQFASFQTVTVTFAAAGFVSQYAFLSQEIGKFRYVFALGAGINALLLLFTLAAILSRRLCNLLRRAVHSILHALHIKRAAEIDRSLAEQLALYQQSAACLRQNVPIVCLILAVTTLQIIAFYSIPYWVYLSLGLPLCSFWLITSIQAVLHVAVSSLPLPGAVGASESAFLLLFQAIFPAAALHDAMLLNRGVSFYLFVALSGIAVAFSLSRQKKNSEAI